MGKELAKPSAPSQPFMVCASRFIILSIDAHILETLYQLLGAEHLVHAFRATHHEEVVNLFIEFVSSCEHAIVGSLWVKPEDGSAESAHIGELVHVIKYDVESLMASP